MITFDTNILFYAVDNSAGEKHRKALHLMAEIDPRDGLLVLQTLGELCYSVGRKRPEMLDRTHRVVQQLTATFQIVSATPADLNEAIEAQSRHGLSFWDAMLWATARRAGCSILLTEDFQEGRTLEGVTFRNPFTMRPAELKALLTLS